MSALVLNARKGAFSVHWSVNVPEIERVVEIVSLPFTLPPNVHVVNDEEFFIDMGRPQQVQAGRGPESGPTPE